QFPYMKGRILDRNIQLAQSYGRVRFKRALLLLSKADMQVKNSIGPSDVLAEHLVAQLCQ
ncbi:MAG: DNA polymerase III subunit delta, partial [Chlamydiia bacterium]|nr:DNA polymerase III subunit delta [Chlamydiia bacterium]